MGAFLGALMSGVSSLIGGNMAQRNQQEVNQQNMQNQLYLDTHHIQDVVGDAKAAGINPLAALGVNTPSAPVAVGSPALGDSVAQAGQDIGRAVTSNMQPADKDAALRHELLQTQVDSAKADLISQQLDNSHKARTYAAAGSAPGLPVHNIPMPTPDPRTVDTLPLYQDYRGRHGERVTLLSRDASEALMNMPSGLVMGAPIGVGLGQENVGNAWSALRPDVGRFFSAPKWNMPGAPVPFVP